MRKSLWVLLILLAASAQAATVNVNCAAGQSVQAAIDANPSPVDIAISGLCFENVLIRDKDVTLRGTTKPSLDGIRGSLTVRESLATTITSLSFENSNGIALQVNGGSFVTADNLTFNATTRRPINVSDAQFFCTACDINSGSAFAVLASRGAIVSLLDSAVTGRRGIFASDGGTLADIDCASVETTHPCFLRASDVAAQAVDGGTVSLFVASDFTGQLIAEERGTVQLVGALQTQTPLPNSADFFGRIVTEAFFDVSPSPQSRLMATNVAHFGQVLVADSTELRGSIQCTRAGDAYLDPQVIVFPGVTVTGCDHAAR